MKLTLESQRSSVTPLFLDFEDSLRVLMSMFLFHMKSLKMCSCDQLSAAQFQKLFEELDKDAIKQVGIWWSFMKSLKLCVVLCDNIVPWSVWTNSTGCWIQSVIKCHWFFGCSRIAFTINGVPLGNFTAWVWDCQRALNTQTAWLFTLLAFLSDLAR